jgi:carbonic anhydrase
VLGHSGCGAVKATVTALKEGNRLPGYIAGLVRIMKLGFAPVLRRCGDLESSAVEANVRHNVDRLRRAAPILADLVDKGELSVVGGVYDLATGRVQLT